MTSWSRRISSLDGAINASVVKGLEAVQAASDAEVPVDTGALKASSRIVPDGRGGGVIAYDEQYAVYVHEDLTAHHDHGSAKFLERAVRAKQREVVNAMADEMRRGFRRAR